ncbi:hypothetical protein LMG26690_03578 [Achromobacter animicus]|uniref:Cell division protein FtsL n=1 Tax=Achromobacter animicus TaxID=1389935 RepID=A0A6S7A6X4_9BURK|nr:MULTISPECIES: hypothetical protein [Achromobacter]CAB3716835.1 hypothetical protein LMG26690_03578 [Achromobacter animicus]
MISQLRNIAPYLIGATLVAALFMSVRWYGFHQFHAGMAKANAEHTLTELHEFKNQTMRLAVVSNSLEDALAILRAARSMTIQRYTRVEAQRPLPADCRIDAERLRHINEAGRLANSSGEPGSTVPAGAGSHK